MAAAYLGGGRWAALAGDHAFCQAAGLDTGQLCQGDADGGLKLRRLNCGMSSEIFCGAHSVCVGKSDREVGEGNRKL
jgi:hypothetical protein